ncbi:unnamed protein product [Oppiella nova]|uniref:ABC transporter domain-containing protein n=1 Tax=Oppiella nova TaxID=334625 RepID=A0A7R9QFK2_9ACAR|nr:unnamed protein product [Oppiella nova]CAG2164007.1 unnamed protein product [Oppiella nova]
MAKQKGKSVEHKIDGQLSPHEECISYLRTYNQTILIQLIKEFSHKWSNQSLSDGTIGETDTTAVPDFPFVNDCKMKVGDPSDNDTLIGPMISETHQQKVLKYIEFARKDGATVTSQPMNLSPDLQTGYYFARKDGATVTSQPMNLSPDLQTGYYVSPTVITDVPDSSVCMKDEIFGPVVCVVPFDTQQEVIDRANDSPYGLSASVWSSRVDRVHSVANRLKVGTVWANCWLVRNLNMPFGGHKHSGTGRESTADSREFYTEKKSICIHGNGTETKVPYPVNISWHNINVFSKKTRRIPLPFRKDKDKPSVHILKNVSGQAKSGQLLAIMGSSGAGKTTLNNVLTQRNLSEVDVQGSVKLNGKIVDSNDMKSLSAYVQQEDIFIGNLTVGEHMRFQSRVRMDQSMSQEVRESRVKQVLQELGLTKCMNTKIGAPDGEKGISGGEKKRLAVASELLTNPSILFCDEPTSGLDSYMALNVVEVLRDMAQTGRTIVCTIHQPSSEVFALFTQLLLMADGRFWALLWRAALAAIREPMLTTVRLGQTVILAVVFGLIYWQLDVNQAGIMDINGALFLLIANITFQNIFGVVTTFCIELPVFLREHNNGMYRVSAYFLSKILAELPSFMFNPLLYVSIFYWMVGLNSGIKEFCICVAICLLVADTACSFGYLVSCMSSGITMALTIAPTIIMPMMIFGGFFLNNDSIPVYFVWFKYISWFYYGNEALSINQWKSIDHIDCEFKMPTNQTIMTPCTPNGKVVIETLNFNEDHLLRNILLLVVLSFAIKVMPMTGKISSVSQPVSISWHNINVFSKPSTGIRLPFRKKDDSSVHILKNVSGHVNSGQLLAIMGSSGAGKTTLMNVLTQRNLSDVKVNGSVKLNGKIMDYNTIKSLSAYVQQDDMFIANITVREHLKFQSRVRMDQSTTLKFRESRIHQVLLDLGLNKCADTMIGAPEVEKGISGGERKRLSIASELLTDPSVMFCDEPTSGLDSFMAQNIMDVLREMAASGRTMICTIHQPSSQVFSMIDQLLLMAEGRIAFMGQTGKAVEFFGSLNMLCPNNYNPSDFYINQLAVVPGNEIECRKQINNICDRYLESNYAKEALPQQTSHTNHNDFQLESNSANSVYKTNCLSKSVNIHNYEQIKYEVNQIGISNINGALFLLVNNMNFQSLFGVVNAFCGELPIFQREHNNGMYRVSAYYLAKQLAELPTFTIGPIIFVAIFYWMVGLNHGVEQFLLCVLICVMTALSATSFGYLVSCNLCDDCPQRHQFCTYSSRHCYRDSNRGGKNDGEYYKPPKKDLSPTELMILSIPVWLDWIKYISMFYYSNEALIINQWRDIDHIDCPSNGTMCAPNGKAVIQSLSFNEDHFSRDLLMLLTLTIVVRILAFLVLLLRSRRR